MMTKIAPNATTIVAPNAKPNARCLYQATPAKKKATTPAAIDSTPQIDPSIERTHLPCLSSAERFDV